MPRPFIIDGHLDLAWNTLYHRRDYLRPVAAIRAEEYGSETVARTGTAVLGLPELRAANIVLVCATLYVPPGHVTMSETIGYQNPDDAHRQYSEQLDLYHRWADERPDDFALIRSREEMDALIDLHERGEPAPIGLIVLMEGADGIREPGELEWWLERGVRLIGLSWSSTRYAGGTGAPGPLTPLGRDLLEQMAARQVILDLSHLSDEGMDEALSRYDGPLLASHAAARRLLPRSTAPERHLSDHAIRGIAERDGLVGIALGGGFLLDGWQLHRDRRQLTLEHVAQQVATLCQLIGDAEHVALGTDLDGGFGLEAIPTGLDSVADLPRLGDVLSRWGFSDEAIFGIFADNWLRFLRRTLPASDG